MRPAIPALDHADSSSRNRAASLPMRQCGEDQRAVHYERTPANRFRFEPTANNTAQIRSAWKTAFHPRGAMFQRRLRTSG